jgi:phosphate acetyltransferase
LYQDINELLEAIYRKAQSDRKRIVLPESEDDRTLLAVAIAAPNGWADLTVLGNVERVSARMRELGVDPDLAQIRDPQTDPRLDVFAHEFHELRKHKGMTPEKAAETVRDPLYFGTMMVHMGEADGFVSGACHSTGETVKPALQIIKTKPGTSVVSSCFFMGIPGRISLFADCAIMPCPTAEELAEIAIDTAASAKAFGIEPKVGMISFSTAGSASHPLVDKVVQATAIARKKAPHLQIDGEMQFDAAWVPEIGSKKFPGSSVAGHVNVFIFPDLQVGNTVYKAVQRIAGAEAVGPLLQGMNKPVNDLSRGCSVEDIANLVALTAVQAQAQ